MPVCIADTEAQLSGDWTIHGLTGNIESLTISLQEMEQTQAKNLNIDCGQIEKADICGFELLYLWMQCVRFRGVEPTLVNVPKGMSQAMHECRGQR